MQYFLPGSVILKFPLEFSHQIYIRSKNEFQPSRNQGNRQIAGVVRQNFTGALFRYPKKKYFEMVQLKIVEKR